MDEAIAVNWVNILSAPPGHPSLSPSLFFVNPSRPSVHYEKVFANMSAWDDEDWEETPVPSSASALSTAVGNELGNWDDEDASEEEEEQVYKKPSAPMKPSKQRALALKEKEEMERKKEVERILEREKQLAEMSAVERKMHQQHLVEESDLQNARDLFMDGGGGADDGMLPPAEPTLETFKPVTDADYQKFAAMVGEKCTQLNNTPKRTLRYVNFVKDLMRVLVKDLGPDDTKDLATFMGILSNEKRDEFKKSKGFKKKTSKKTHVRMDRPADVREDNFKDFADDFM